MSLWFGPFAGVAPDHGYFHLCPRCYFAFVDPHLEQVQGRLAEMQPLTKEAHSHGPDPS